MTVRLCLSEQFQGLLCLRVLYSVKTFMCCATSHDRFQVALVMQKTPLATVSVETGKIKKKTSGLIVARQCLFS